jgi:hypothetical protein
VTPSSAAINVCNRVDSEYLRKRLGDVEVFALRWVALAMNGSWQVDLASMIDAPPQGV